MEEAKTGHHKDLDREFATSTTLHGIGRVIDSARISVKLAWLAIFLTCTCVCTWQITDRFMKYLEHNVNTGLSVEYVQDLKFPAVTICNFNRYRKSAISNDTGTLKYALMTADYDYDPYDDEANINITEHNNFSYANFTKRAGFILDNDTLIGCKWRGKPNSCNEANFTHVFTSFGNCWTFNTSGKGKNSSNLIQSQPGSGNGLELLIDIQQREYTETIDGNNEAGLKILVHDQHTPATSVDTAGLAIMPGVHAFIGVRQKEYGNLEPPWGKCNKDKQLEYFDKYTLEGCTIECRAKTILEECKCRLVRHPGNARECLPEDVEECATPTLVKIKSGVLPKDGCSCPVPCNYTEYRTSLSLATMPNNNVINELWEKYAPDKISNSTLHKTAKYSYMRENWILLDVYYNALNYERLQQSEEITTSALMSDIGGQLGLFLGASFITVAEILAYLSHKVRRWMSKCTKRDGVEPRDDAVDIKELASKDPRA